MNALIGWDRVARLLSVSPTFNQLTLPAQGMIIGDVLSVPLAERQECIDDLIACDPCVLRRAHEILASHHAFGVEA